MAATACGSLSRDPFGKVQPQRSREYGVAAGLARMKGPALTFWRARGLDRVASLRTGELTSLPYAAGNPQRSPTVPAMGHRETKPARPRTTSKRNRRASVASALGDGEIDHGDNVPDPVLHSRQFHRPFQQAGHGPTFGPGTTVAC
jgi:hypothetical protein